MWVFLDGSCTIIITALKEKKVKNKYSLKVWIKLLYSKSEQIII